MPKIIFRLLLSFIAFVTLFVLIRQFVIPDSFGKYGHYRANSIDDNKARPLFYKGEKKCIECHQDIYDLQSADVHSEISCETCHPPIINATSDCKLNIPELKGTIEFCAQCHTKNAAREAIGFPNIDIEEHKGNKNCIECHNPHAPWELTE
ncbi:hypothetical protein GCM10007962_15910 [Yeosuana aromativorans]|uniref:Uncharacterized protein n=1 Tax=Yeosuana aromativorans TaxID=288019 RepID=A0A8J3BMT1_9FLAO|nr:hypothetical protein [Yeosuana aromativorans]GGK22533.1 hypothetical protein GCM10007962_15910 [Yeosuana aromativorans]